MYHEYDNELGLAFLLELAMLAAFGFWGFHTGGTISVQLLLGIGGPLTVAVFRGLFMAPRAYVHLPAAAHLFASIFLFGLASLALYESGLLALALILAGLFAANRILSAVWKQWH